MAAARRVGLIAAAAATGAALWWRANPSACPYSQRFWVQAPHPGITRERLRAILEPRAGERILEVGPGTGYYSLDAAGWVAPGGRLDLVDVQEEMLDHTMSRAHERGLENVFAHLADARSLPFPDSTFDAAYLVTVLGEIPDQAAALAELRRVLRPGGRLVVGELFGDPHMVTHAALVRRASEAGLSLDRKLGGRIWHYTRLAA